VQETLFNNLRFAAKALKSEGIKLLVEAINTFDIPGFAIARTPQVLALIRDIGSDNLFVQYDIYHMQRMEGSGPDLQSQLQHIAHIQLADNPGRHEPGTGEINYPYLFSLLDRIGYQGWLAANISQRAVLWLVWDGLASTCNSDGTRRLMKIGFIGLGIMGAPMAVHLARSGHVLFVNSRGGLPPSLAEHPVTVCDKARQVAELAEVTILMLPDTPDVDEVLFGTHGVAEADLRGKVVVDMSSISPLETKQFAKRIEQLGGHYLDAPVSGERWAPRQQAYPSW
jgi:hypothetical protein